MAWGLSESGYTIHLASACIVVLALTLQIRQATKLIVASELTVQGERSARIPAGCLVHFCCRQLFRPWRPAFVPCCSALLRRRAFHLR